MTTYTIRHYVAPARPFHDAYAAIVSTVSKYRINKRIARHKRGIVHHNKQAALFTKQHLVHHRAACLAISCHHMRCVRTLKRELVGL